LEFDVPLVTRTNLVTNPSFETGTTGWLGVGTTLSLLAVDTSQKYVGLQSMKVTCQSTSGGASFALSGLTVGAVYTMSGYVYIPTSGGANAVATHVAGFTSGDVTTTVKGAWTRIAQTFIATATSHSIQFNFASTPASGQIFYLDAVFLEAPPVAQTNLALDPAATGLTNWSPLGSTTSTRITDTTTFHSGTSSYKQTLTASGTSGAKCAVSNPGFAAGDTIKWSVWVYPSVTMTIQPYWERPLPTYTGGSGGAAISCPANTWTQITGSLTLTSANADATASYGFGFLSTAAWASGNSFNADEIEVERNVATLGTYIDGSTAQTATTYYAWTGAPNASSSVALTTPFTYFDGSSVNANSRMYAWLSGANASTSTEKTYTPDIGLVAKTDAPCPRVEVTLTNFTPTDNSINLWVMADGVRRAVRGAREITVNDSTLIIDYEVALNRQVDFSIEILSGLNVGASVPTQSITVTSDTWWIQDPLVPTSAVAVDSGADYPDSPALTAAALKQLEYAADISVIPIMGSNEPVAIGGERLAASGVPWNMVTTAAQATTNLRNLLKQCTTVLIRPGANGAGDEIPGKAYMAVQKPVEKPVTVAWNGEMTLWELVGDTVAPPTLRIQVPVWTYGDVKALFATYQQALDAHTGDTYLDVLKSPSGA
jgi:hypothetical protein